MLLIQQNLVTIRSMETQWLSWNYIAITSKNFRLGSLNSRLGCDTIGCMFNKLARCKNYMYQFLTFQRSSVTVKEGGTIYDYSWYPLVDSADPASCCFITTTQSTPMHLWDSLTGELISSYRFINHLVRHSYLMLWVGLWVLAFAPSSGVLQVFFLAFTKMSRTIVSEHKVNKFTKIFFHYIFMYFWSLIILPVCMGKARQQTVDVLFALVAGSESGRAS